MNWVACGLYSGMLLGAGCSGGGNSGPPAAPPPPPAPINRAPIVVNANADQRFIELHPSRYEATQGGMTFADPDGDPLTYAVHVSYPFDDIAVQGTTISGSPRHPHMVASVSITATDGAGAMAVDQFDIVVRPNAVPTVVRPNLALFTGPGEHVNYDPTQGGSAFLDADGDGLSYAVSVVSPPLGLAVDGGRVVGSLSAVGVVRFEVAASDGYGGSATDAFAIVAPAPEPGKPNLPSPPFSYADEELALPYAFRQSRQFFAPFWDTTLSSSNPPTNAGATLGRVLFYDERLSITNTHSCSSCHEQAHNFARPERFSSGVLGVPQSRNAMSLANARYNLDDRYFVDERVDTLEGLVLLPIVEPTELGNFLPLLVDKLAATDFYPPLFDAAFGTPEVTAERIRLALAQFVRALISYRSPFDHGAHPMDSSELPNLSAVLTAQELRGATIFFGDGTTAIPFRCASCHATGALLMDTPGNNGLDVVSADPGAFLERFRTPSLRSIAVSAPYMHDGRFATLREVIDHYDHGIQDSPQLSPGLRESSTGPVLRMNLTESDEIALEAFLHTLTDVEFLQDPRLSDPFQ